VQVEVAVHIVELKQGKLHKVADWNGGATG
jgi:hypothetical protein